MPFDQAERHSMGQYYKPNPEDTWCDRINSMNLRECIAYP
jgi:hypothetical protein